MANTAPRVAAEEREESPDAVDRKAEVLADQIRRSKHFIAFTGAGISTSAGIPDFRGPEGVWTLMAQKRESSRKTTNTLQAIPTPTHMALVELQNRGLLKYLVSQNCDGLHRRSGILPDRISELHGNTNREYCKDCGKEYMRDLYAVTPDENPLHDHRTGRKCALCNGNLLDSIIHFGEFLPEQALELARQHADRADLCLALGSSLTVPPACDLPEAVGRRRGAALAVCNLQDTPLDELCRLRVHARADDFMARVMASLGIPIPPFVLRRRLVVAGARPDDPPQRPGARRLWQVVVRGEDVDGTPSSFLRAVRCAEVRRVVRSEPFCIVFRRDPEVGADITLELEFMGHYGEPNLEIKYRYGGQDDEKAVYQLEYSHGTGEWNIIV